MLGQPFNSRSYQPRSRRPESGNSVLALIRLQFLLEIAKIASVMRDTTQQLRIRLSFKALEANQ